MVTKLEHKPPAVLSKVAAQAETDAIKQADSEEAYEVAAMLSFAGQTDRAFRVSEKCHPEKLLRDAPQTPYRPLARQPSQPGGIPENPGTLRRLPTVISTHYGNLVQAKVTPISRIEIASEVAIICIGRLIVSGTFQQVSHRSDLVPLTFNHLRANDGAVRGGESDVQEIGSNLCSGSCLHQWPGRCSYTRSRANSAPRTGILLEAATRHDAEAKPATSVNCS